MPGEWYTNNTTGEIMTTINWNVYKIFANGKRAKFPMQTFEYADESLVFEFFTKQIKPTFTTKQQKSKYTLIRADLPQERGDNAQRPEEVLHQKRSKVFRQHLKNLNKAPMANKNTQFGMILCEESEWKWQWAAIESGTCQYLLGVSPLFTSHAAAIEWMDSQI